MQGSWKRVRRDCAACVGEIYMYCSDRAILWAAIGLSNMYMHGSFFSSGEKLSKKELQNGNVIKKLKEKNKQNDQLVTSQKYNYTCVHTYMDIACLMSCL